MFAQGLNHFLPLETWNDDLASHPTICLNCVDRNVICVKRKLPRRRHGCPCLYYANSDATFHLKLIGDLVLKLNPGPLSRSIPTIVSRHESSEITKAFGDVIHGISLACSPTDFSRHYKSSLSLCLLNARSVRNKTAMIVDYLCDLKADL